ncbi:MAG: gluconate 2-dehydrogenase subunit 3 family protein [Bacteroidota bacterium]
MNRREVLRYAAMATGAAVSAPFASAFLMSCEGEVTPPEVVYEPQFFSSEEYQFITKVADTILPKTDTPSASEVGVPEMIDKVVGKVYNAESQAEANAGIAALKAKMDADNGEGGFTGLDAAAALAYLQKMDAEYKNPDINWMEESEENQILRGTYFEMKSATISYYFSSEEVATTQLAYLPVPGEYIPCGDVQELSGGKAWAI